MAQRVLVAGSSIDVLLRIALIGIYLACLAVGSLAGEPWEPLLALRSRHLLALYPLKSDVNDYAPHGTINGYAQHGRFRNPPTPSSSGGGTRLNVQSGIDLPLTLSPRVFPELTMGAWVQLDEAASRPTGYDQLSYFISLLMLKDTNRLLWCCCRCLLSQNGSSIGRSICLQSGQWVINQHETFCDVSAAVKNSGDNWIHVVVTFSLSESGSGTSVRLVLNGQTTAAFTSQDAIGTPAAAAVIGAASGDTFGGIKGTVKNVFFYDVALSSAEIRYVMTTSVDDVPVAVGRWGYALSLATDEQQAYLSIDMQKSISRLNTTTLAFWMAPKRTVQSDFCVCQLFSASTRRFLTVWAYYSLELGINLLRIRHSALPSGRVFDDHVFSSLPLPADDRWHHIAVTWSESQIAVMLDRAANVSDTCTRSTSAGLTIVLYMLS